MSASIPSDLWWKAEHLHWRSGLMNCLRPSGMSLSRDDPSISARCSEVWPTCGHQCYTIGRYFWGHWWLGTRLQSWLLWFMLVSSLFIGCDPLNLPLTLGSYGALILAGLKPTLVWPKVIPSFSPPISRPWGWRQNPASVLVWISASSWSTWFY